MLNRLTEYMLRCFNINVESVRDNAISQLFVPFIQNPQYLEREQRWVAETFPASQIRARLVPTCEQVLAMGKDLPPSADIKSWLDSRRSWEERVSQIARCT